MAVSSAYLTAPCILSALYRAAADADHLGGIMGMWFWLNIPLGR
jgi:hypothetical protein